MNIVFVSNYFNHHQRPLSDALATLSNYTFVATVPMTEERRTMGWGTEKEPEYVCHYDQDRDAVIAKLDSADVVIAGSAPEDLVRRCIQRGKVVFRYAERPLKNGLEWGKFFPRLLKWHLQNPWKKPVYMLCASAYTAGDYAKFGLFRNKTIKWGYFPEVKQYASADTMLNQKRANTILWVGRFLDWKHPDDALRVAARLKADGFDFQMNIIGNGPLEPKLREEIACWNLEDNVHLLGTMTPHEVRRHMEESQVFLFTSDRKEGWGAVLNEAMNSGCAVVASDAAGATPFLVQDGSNGYVYPSQNVEELYRKVAGLLSEPNTSKRLGLAASETIAGLWNAQVAAQRFLSIAEQVCKGHKLETLFTEGPGSPAEIIREDWYTK